MDNALKEIIAKSKLHVEDGTYVVRKVKDKPAADHFLVTVDSFETTVITAVDRISELSLIERNKDDYALIRLDVAIPFYSVGFLAAVTDTIAKQEMNILVVSTYSKDYILVLAEHKSRAVEALKAMGFRAT